MAEVADQEYFAARERQSREMAEKTPDPGVRAVHLELARAYARRLKLMRAA